MGNISTVLIVAGMSGLAWTGVRYFLNGRYVNADMIGADTHFHHMWLLSVILVAIGAGMLPGHHWTWGVAVGGAGCMLALPTKTLAARAFRLVGWGAMAAPNDALATRGSIAAVSETDDGVRRVSLHRGVAPDAVRHEGSGRGG